MRPERIPLFPLNVVLLPGAELPLHIFELRYRQMVKRCMTHKSEFGIILSLPTGVARVGCTAEILEVVKRHRDGRMDILTVGREPFRVMELFTSAPLLEGQLEYLEDHEESSDPSIQRQLVELYETCHTLIFGDYPKNIDRQLSGQLSYVIAGTLPMELLWKQQVLELRSEIARQERLVEYLRQWAPHLDKTGPLRRRAIGSSHGLN